jgi:acetolactate synthase I/II/III large subunit
MKMTGAQIFIKTLQDLGVDTVFGYPGGVVLFIYDELYKQDSIKHILVRHEQGAVHMADGYAKVTGRPGVALVTSGPGATNTVTGLATAHMDSVPLVCFTGQVPVSMIGNDAFQEADVVGITRPCTKHNFLVKDVNDLERIIHEAFYIASTGRPGPVVVDIPKDVTTNEAEYQGIKEVTLRGYKPAALVPEKSQVEKAIDIIFSSKKPVLYIGGGIVAANAEKELMELAELLQIPVGITLMGLGGFPGMHPLSMGMLGMHGGYWANMAMSESDLLIALGPRFDDRVTGRLDLFAPKSKKIHLDIDASSIGKNVSVDCAIVGDAKEAIKMFLEVLREKPAEELRSFVNTLEPWRQQVTKWRTENPISYDQNPNGPILPQYVIEKIFEVTQGDAIITTDVGQHQMWAAQFYHFKHPRRWCTSGGLGTMGYGYPAALGAQIVDRKEPVVCISGDGSFMMNLQEIATAVQFDLPVVVAIINNLYLGMVRQWQQFFYDKRYSESSMLPLPDFVKLAESFGAVGFMVDQVSDVEPTLKKSLELRKPVIIDFRVSPDENVFPMIPAGKGHSEMLLA